MEMVSSKAVQKKQKFQKKNTEKREFPMAREKRKPQKISVSLNITENRSEGFGKRNCRSKNEEKAFPKRIMGYKHFGKVLKQEKSCRNAEEGSRFEKKEDFMDTLLFVLCFLLFLLIFVALLVLLRRQSQWQRETHAVPPENPDGVTKDELGLLLRQLSTNFSQQLRLLGENLNSQNVGNRQQMEAMRAAVDEQVRYMRQENTANLEEIRRTVDEKLQTTLEQRLGESFRQVGGQLEQVYRGLGEMRHLAANVDDLQKLLRNVKVRGTWGEVQLGAILEQMLAPGQFAANVRPDPNSSETVEYAVKIPKNEGGFLWLPLDAKCPLEDYRRLTEAEANNSQEERQKARQALQNRLKNEAKTIRDKYIRLPYTTDFAVLFLPLEGLFAEVLRQPDLCDTLQKEYRVLVAGPTTLAALLNILQVGFRSLAIQEKSGELWELLEQIKGEFSQFGEVLERTGKKLREAENALDPLATRVRVMNRRLKKLETMESPHISRESSAEKS